MTNAIIMTVEGVRTRVSTQEILITFSAPIENAAIAAQFVSKVGKQVGIAFAEIGSSAIGLSEQPISQQDKRISARGASAQGGKITEGDRNQKYVFGAQAKTLRLSGFFLNPQVLQTLGTDDAYRTWVQRQPSAWSGEYDYPEGLGEGRCEAAHCRRINTGAGMQIKNDYACIPLTHEEHSKQTNHGESVFNTVEHDGREWFERKRAEYVTKWGWNQLKEIMKVKSMRDANPNDVLKWARVHNLERFLPTGYGDE